ncbi:MAG: zeta toxin family protein [Daejeonella sp.]
MQVSGVSGSMQVSDDQKPYLLSTKDHQQIYSEIKAYYTSRLQLKQANQEKCTAIFLGAQPGSGKTALKNHLLSKLSIEKSTIVINTDELREFHPQYRELLAEPIEFAKAPYLVNPDASMWTQKLCDDALKANYNLLFDSTLGGSPNTYINLFNRLKNSDYQLHLAILAVKPELSTLGIHLRYERQLAAEGSGRFVNTNVHDLNYNNLLPNLKNILTQASVDITEIYTRKVLLSQNRLLNNTVECLKSSINQNPFSYPVFEDVILKERSRSWTDVEKEYLRLRILQVSDLIQKRSGDLSAFKSKMQTLIPIVEDNPLKSKGIRL